MQAADAVSLASTTGDLTRSQKKNARRDLTRMQASAPSPVVDNAKLLGRVAALEARLSRAEEKLDVASTATAVHEDHFEDRLGYLHELVAEWNDDAKRETMELAKLQDSTEQLSHLLRLKAKADEECYRDLEELKQKMNYCMSVLDALESEESEALQSNGSHSTDKYEDEEWRPAAQEEPKDEVTSCGPKEETLNCYHCGDLFLGYNWTEFQESIRCQDCEREIEGWDDHC